MQLYPITNLKSVLRTAAVLQFLLQLFMMMIFLLLSKIYVVIIFPPWSLSPITYSSPKIVPSSGWAFYKSQLTGCLGPNRPERAYVAEKEHNARSEGYTICLNMVSCQVSLGHSSRSPRVSARIPGRHVLFWVPKPRVWASETPVGADDGTISSPNWCGGASNNVSWSCRTWLK